MTRSAPDLRIPVGVVIERRKATNPWAYYVWRPVAILPGRPEVAPWTELGRQGDATSFYAGDTEVLLFHADTPRYRDNLQSGTPSLWVVLRPTDDEPPFGVVTVTADSSEGEGYTAAGADLVDFVPMPDAIRDAIAAFVAEHHVEQEFFKLPRKASDPEALARRPRGDKRTRVTGDDH